MLLLLLVVYATSCRKGCKDSTTTHTLLLECRSGELDIQIRQDGEEFLYWAIPTGASEPVKQLSSGVREHEGTGACALRRWTFKDGVDTYVVEDVGCTEQAVPTGTIAFHIETVAGNAMRSPCIATSAPQPP